MQGIWGCEEWSLLISTAASGTQVAGSVFMGLRLLIGMELGRNPMADVGNDPTHKDVGFPVDRGGDDVGRVSMNCMF